MKTWIPVKEFSQANRLVHHISAVFFIGALLLMGYDKLFGSSDAMYLHQSFGVIVFVLYFSRVLLMSWFGKPEALGTQVEKFAAHMAHFALYSILIFMPLSGLLVNATRARETVVFGIFSIPGFAERHMDMYLLALDLHSALQWVCYLLLAAHVGASLFHHFVLKDETLSRMWGKTN
ncbi:cytochrome b [Thalassotalea sp. PLHSN55]|uniref:cytochrome b n=1 Tax=Thalassotalea sp. PLHSN55 TaxID=3435888 RepID=UPI003F86F8F5